MSVLRNGGLAGLWRIAGPCGRTCSYGRGRDCRYRGCCLGAGGAACKQYGARGVYIGGDPVRHGLVESINRPGRHVTGILFNPNVLGAKRVELLREIAPNVSRIALLMNPTNPNFKIEEGDAEAGAKKLGLETVTLTAKNASEMELRYNRCWLPRLTH